MLNASGNFSGTTVSIFSDDACTEDLGSDSSAEGSTADVYLNEINLKELDEGKLTFYVQEFDGTTYSECSSIHDIDLEINFGLNTTRSCSEDNDCTKHHPSAICISSICQLPPGSETKYSSWCMSDSESNGECSTVSNDGACTIDDHCESGFCSARTNTCQELSEQLVAVGKDFTCFAIDGEPKCFGKNDYGQLGNGNTNDNYTPSSVIKTNGENLENIVQLTTGTYHACALNASGEVWCWGAGAQNLYADGSSADKNSGAVKISGVTAESVSTYDNYSCAVTTDGELKCWGNAVDQAMGGQGPYTSPTITISSDVEDIKAEYRTSCVKFTSGLIKCMGRNHDGATGQPVADAATTLSELLADSSDDLAIINNSDEIMYATNYDIGYRTGCLVDEDKNAYCWGNNSNGELSANSEATHSHETVQANTSTGVTSVAVGNMVSCFLLEDKLLSALSKQHRST